MSNTKGLYGKYIITKSDGTPVNGRCFILKPDKDPAAVTALQAYAAVTGDEQLRDDLYAWVGKPLTIDAAPAVHGRWIEHVHVDEDGDCSYIDCECSVCHATEHFEDDGMRAFCPNCGAKMDINEHPDLQASVEKFYEKFGHLFGGDGDAEVED